MLGFALTPVAQHLSRGQAVAPDPMRYLATTDGNLIQLSMDATEATITVAAPSVHVGSYTVQIADLAAGPVNLAPAVITGTPEPGKVLTATSGLWVYDTALGAMMLGSSWLLDGSPIAGETGASVTVDATHAGRAISHSENAAQGGLSRSAVSAAVTVEMAEPPPEPMLELAMTDGSTLQVSPDVADVTITVTAPSVHAGTYALQVADLETGPVNLVAAAISGTPEPGEVLTATEGLWVYDISRGAMTLDTNWRLDGSPLAGETGASIPVDPSYADHTISYAETASQGSLSRSVASAAVTIIATEPPPVTGVVFDSFTSAAPLPLADYVGESGLSYVHNGGLPVTGTVTSGRLTHSDVKNQLLMRGSQTYSDCFAEAVLRRGDQTRRAFSVGLAVRITETGEGYFVTYRQPAMNSFELYKEIGGSITLLAQFANDIPGFTTAGDLVELRLEAQGSQLHLLWRMPGTSQWTLMGSATDTDFASGGVGVRVGGPTTLGLASELDNFGGGML